MAFHVGQKVVCVDDESHNGWSSDLDGLHAGSIYTVRRIGIWGNRNHPEAPCLWLSEILRTPCLDTGSVDMPFNPLRFRPVIERKTDTGMAILRKVAADASRAVTVRAKAPSSERA